MHVSAAPAVCSPLALRVAAPSAAPTAASTGASGLTLQGAPAPCAGGVQSCTDRHAPMAAETGVERYAQVTTA